MLISNMEVVPGKKIATHLGLVQGSTVRAKHAGRDIMAGLKNIFGGETSFSKRGSSLRRVRTVKTVNSKVCIMVYTHAHSSLV